MKRIRVTLFSVCSLAASLGIHAQEAQKPQKREESRKAQDQSDSPAARNPAPAAETRPVSPHLRAEGILNDGLAEKSADKRAKAVIALGLLRGDSKARRQALAALKDENSNVRAAAAAALGSMRAAGARQPLEEALDDSEPAVVLAAANSLVQLKDDAGFDVYYNVLTGEQKTTPGLFHKQLAILHDKKRLAQIGLDEGIGFVPFAGIPYGVLKMVLKDDSSGVRAAAARKLESDPDPRSAGALVDALNDKSWVVRAAAVEALTHRKDARLLSKIVPALDDDKDNVRYLAAAAVISLSRLKPKMDAVADTAAK
jgi:HEAT repeat protein